jgi:hypothetical protein
LKPCAKASDAPFLMLRLDVVLVDGADLLVGQQDHHDVGAFTASATSATFRPAFSTLDHDGAALAQADGDLDAAVVQVLRVGMALRAVADDGDVLALDEAQVGVLVVIDLHGSLRCCQWPPSARAPFGAPMRGRRRARRMRSPRPMPLAPVRTVSRMAARSMRHDEGVELG